LSFLLLFARGFELLFFCSWIRVLSLTWRHSSGFIAARTRSSRHFRFLVFVTKSLRTDQPYP